MALKQFNRFEFHYSPWLEVRAIIETAIKRLHEGAKLTLVDCADENQENKKTAALNEPRFLLCPRLDSNQHT